MKKIITLIATLILTVCACFSLTACGTQKVVEDGGTIVVGVTDYPPMDYLDNSGKWVGFDAELAEKVFTELGYKVEFKEIDWDTKIVTLNAGTIDCIWNGMTVTDELLENVLLSNVYLQNRQVVVAKTANIDAITTKTNLAGKIVAVESGSAAESAVESLGCSEVRKDVNQNTAVLEVFAGTADYAVVDYAIAKTLCGAGSDYYGQIVMKEIDFAVEEFAIAFRKADSKLCFNVNKLITKYYNDGTIATLANTYEVANQLVG